MRNLMLLLVAAISHSFFSHSRISFPCATAQPLGYAPLSQSDSIFLSLQDQANQQTTAAILFNTTTVASFLTDYAPVTFLAPDDNAWSEFNAIKADGKNIQTLLQGPNGSAALILLLKYHVITGYNLYVDFQLAPDGEIFNSTIGAPIFLHKSNGQNLFSVDLALSSTIVSSNRPDIHQDGNVSIQGISQVLIPSVSLLVQMANATASAPTPTPTPTSASRVFGPADIPLSTGPHTPPPLGEMIDIPNSATITERAWNCHWLFAAFILSGPFLLLSG